MLSRRLVIGPEREHKPVSLVGPGFDAGRETGDGAVGLSEPSRDLELGLERFMPGERHASKDVAGQ